MDTQKNLNLNRAIALIVFMIGFFLIIIPAYLKVSREENTTFNWELVVVSIGTSVAAAGVVLIVQIFFLGDPSYRVETQLQQVLLRKLPIGVSRLFLRLDDAPKFDELLRYSKRIIFFGPGGAVILSQVADEAMRRKKNQRIIFEMFLPETREEVADNVARPDFKVYSEWGEAINKARLVQAQGKLQLDIYRVAIEPTISAVQVDDSYYQVTMLFPLVANQRRPTLALDSTIAREDYFQPLWNYLRGQVINR